MDIEGHGVDIHSSEVLGPWLCVNMSNRFLWPVLVKRTTAQRRMCRYLAAFKESALVTVVVCLSVVLFANCRCSVCYVGETSVISRNSCRCDYDL